ncbi:hypothetical protein [Psychrosphaera algicola]|uniref:Uncharacterized protein n=1 Tax=Psychrosphaera algicola TaxID=3023714 RepID=A0ABT5F8W4_9GAMM|nr:hypothetical protein [Psychrosphaera sp. G1-22]MDC2887861.1 hypothetical protein [Psychrosphaera sp. G1-22]
MALVCFVAGYQYSSFSQKASSQMTKCTVEKQKQQSTNNQHQQLPTLVNDTVTYQQEVSHSTLKPFELNENIEASNNDDVDSIFYKLQQLRSVHR